MPLVQDSSYKSHPLLFNRHIETIYPSLSRKIKGVSYRRTRLELADGDFLDLDWLTDGTQKKERLVIVSHGLEGSSERHYAKGVAKYFFERDWDALAWNCRSCSGEINRLARLYHHADSGDLGFVIDEAVRLGYKHVALVGFSMSGSFTIKYLGEQGRSLNPAVKSAITFSVPCHLESSSYELDRPSRGFYLKRFLMKLGRKIKVKSEMFPGEVSYEGYEKIKTFEEFHRRYTAPLHGFKNIADFFESGSCRNYFAGVHVPALIINAANDPFLTPPCFPVEELRNHPYIFLEIPQRGGHTGFPMKGNESWMEVRAFEFASLRF